jgi:hypothetical protein
LAAEATEWANAGRDASFLASGARLAQLEALAADSNLALNEQEIAYVHASMAERERREIAERERQARELQLARQSEAAQRRAANRLRYLVVGLAIFLLVAIGLSVFAFNRQAAAVTNLNRSEAQRLAAEANVLLQAHGNAEVTALLSIRSIRSEYTPQGDAALAGAATLDYPVQVFGGHSGPIWSVAYSSDGKYVLNTCSLRERRLVARYLRLSPNIVPQAITKET